MKNSFTTKKGLVDSIYKQEGGEMLNKIGNNDEVLAVLLLAGSHSVSAALLKGQPVTAISEALAVCMCVLIFTGALWLTNYLKVKAKPSLKSHARKRPTKKLTAKKGGKQIPPRRP